MDLITTRLTDTLHAEAGLMVYELLSNSIIVGVLENSQVRIKSLDLFLNVQLTSKLTIRNVTYNYVIYL